MHGPLQATLLVNYVAKFMPSEVKFFEYPAKSLEINTNSLMLHSYRAVSPLVLEGETVDITLCAKQDDKDPQAWNVWILNDKGTVTMTGTAKGQL